MIFQKKSFKKLSSPRVSIELQKVRDELKQIKAEIDLALREFNPFSFEEFSRGSVVNNRYFRERKIKKMIHQIRLISHFTLKDFPFSKKIIRARDQFQLAI